MKHTFLYCYKISQIHILLRLTTRLLIAMVLSVVFAIIVGIVLRVSLNKNWSKREIMYMRFFGEIYLRIMHCLLLPVLGTSLIIAIGTPNLKSSGKIGGRAIIMYTYYLITTFMAVTLGIIFVLTIRPGVNPKRNITQITEDSELRNTTAIDTILDLIRDVFPANIIQACIQQYETVLEHPSSKNTSKY